MQHFLGWNQISLALRCALTPLLRPSAAPCFLQLCGLSGLLSVCEICLFGLCQRSFVSAVAVSPVRQALLLISLPMRTESVTRLDPRSADKQEKQSWPRRLSTTCWQCSEYNMWHFSGFTWHLAIRTTRQKVKHWRFEGFARIKSSYLFACFVCNYNITTIKWHYLTGSI